MHVTAAIHLEILQHNPTTYLSFKEAALLQAVLRWSTLSNSSDPSLIK